MLCQHTGRVSVVGDDLGGASALLLRLRLESPTVVKRVVTAHVSDVRHGRTGKSGRGGQESTLHDERRMGIIVFVFSKGGIKECPLKE